MTTRSLDVMRSRPGLYVIVSFGHVGPVEVDTEGRVYQCTLEDGHPRDGELVEGGWCIENIRGILGPFARIP